jgi:hypothetical protein
VRLLLFLSFRAIHGQRAHVDELVPAFVCRALEAPHHELIRRGEPRPKRLDTHPFTRTQHVAQTAFHRRKHVPAKALFRSSYHATFGREPHTDHDGLCDGTSYSPRHSRPARSRPIRLASLHSRSATHDARGFPRNSRSPIRGRSLRLSVNVGTYIMARREIMGSYRTTGTPYLPNAPRRAGRGVKPWTHEDPRIRW